MEDSEEPSNSEEPNIKLSISLRGNKGLKNAYRLLWLSVPLFFSYNLDLLFEMTSTYLTVRYFPSKLALLALLWPIIWFITSIMEALAEGIVPLINNTDITLEEIIKRTLPIGLLISFLLSILLIPFSSIYSSIWFHLSDQLRTELSQAIRGLSFGVPFLFLYIYLRISLEILGNTAPLMIAVPLSAVIGIITLAITHTLMNLGFESVGIGYSFYWISLAGSIWLILTFNYPELKLFDSEFRYYPDGRFTLDYLKLCFQFGLQKITENLSSFITSFIASLYGTIGLSVLALIELAYDFAGNALYAVNEIVMVNLKKLLSTGKKFLEETLMSLWLISSLSGILIASLTLYIYNLINTSQHILLMISVISISLPFYGITYLTSSVLKGSGSILKSIYLELIRIASYTSLGLLLVLNLNISNITSMYIVLMAGEFITALYAMYLFKEISLKKQISRFTHTLYHTINYPISKRINFNLELSIQKWRIPIQQVVVSFAVG